MVGVPLLLVVGVGVGVCESDAFHCLRLLYYREAKENRCFTGNR